MNFTTGDHNKRFKQRTLSEDDERERLIQKTIFTFDSIEGSPASVNSTSSQKLKPSTNRSLNFSESEETELVYEGYHNTEKISDLSPSIESTESSLWSFVSACYPVAIAYEPIPSIEEVDGTQKIAYQHHRSRWTTRHCLLLLIAFFVPIVCIRYLSRDPDIAQEAYFEIDTSHFLPEGTKIQLSSPRFDNLFIRSASPTPLSEKETLLEPIGKVKDRGVRKYQLIATERTPWLHGSTYEIYRSKSSSSAKHCFQLKSMQNLWLRLDYSTGKVFADGLTKIDGSYFALATSSIDTSQGMDDTKFNQKLHQREELITAVLKLCDEDLVFEVAPIPLYASSSASLSADTLTDSLADTSILTTSFDSAQGDDFQKMDKRKSPEDVQVGAAIPTGQLGTSSSQPIMPKVQYYFRLTKDSMKKRFNSTLFGWILSWIYSTSSSIALLDYEIQLDDSQSPFPPTIIKFHKVNLFYGVNLGGWFIPEVWMNPSFYDGSGLGWSGSLCR